MNRIMEGKRTRSRARLAVVILAGVFALPGAAVADHQTCTPGQPQPAGCEAFDPQIVAGASVSFTDTPSTLSYRFNQKELNLTRHDQPVLGVKYLVPKGWQFALTSLRPGQVSHPPVPGVDPPAAVEGDPATQCSQVYVGEQNDADDTPARLGRAENLSGGVGATGHIDFTRRNNRTPIKWGYTRTSANTTGNRDQDPSVAFLNYDGTTANLCLYYYANHADVAAQSVPPPPATCTGTCLITPSEASREHIIPVTLTKVAPGEMIGSEDISLKFSWKIEFDLTSFYAFPFLRTNEVLLHDVLFKIESLSGGNWHLNDTTGNRESIVLSKTPKVPGDYEFRGIFTTCAEGLQPPPGVIATTEQAEALPVSALCVNGTLFQTVRSAFHKILHPPSATVYDFGKLTGPAGALIQSGTNSTPRFGLVRGTSEVDFTWTQPGVAPGEKIKGYVLTVARVGDLSSRHFEYMITNPADGGFDTRAPCAADGLAPACSVKLTFPLSTISSGELDVNGKYDVTLVTLYEGTAPAPDIRSDGLCDDGTGAGDATCFHAFRITPHTAFDYVRQPGVSSWQFLLREKAWPLAFVEVQNFRRSGTGAEFPAFPAPIYALLVDFSLKQAEFVRWNPLTFEEAFFAPSNGIIGDNAAGAGLVSFSSATMTGHTDNWRFDGFISPVGNGSSVTVAGLRLAPGTRARGLFVQYNLRGLPGAIPPGGEPQLKVLEPFEGNPT